MEKLTALLANPSLRRIVVFLLGFLTVALHRKLGLDLDPGDLYTIAGLSLGMVTASNAKEAIVAHADAKAALADAVLAKAAPPVAPSPSPAS